MRITKKYAGSSCIGKQIFQPIDYLPSDATAVTSIEIHANEDELERFEFAFKSRYIHSNSHHSNVDLESLGNASSSSHRPRQYSITSQDHSRISSKQSTNDLSIVGGLQYIEVASREVYDSRDNDNEDGNFIEDEIGEDLYADANHKKGTVSNFRALLARSRAMAADSVIAKVKNKGKTEKSGYTTKVMPPTLFAASLRRTQSAPEFHSLAAYYEAMPTGRQGHAPHHSSGSKESPRNVTFKSSPSDEVPFLPSSSSSSVSPSPGLPFSAVSSVKGSRSMVNLNGADMQAFMDNDNAAS